MEQRRRDRWTIDWAGDADENGLKQEVATDRLGDHTASRYRSFRRSVDQVNFNQMNDERFGLLLSAESLLDELRVYDNEESPFVRLAQTGFHVRQMRRLHAVLDAAVASYPIQFDETSECSNWESMLRDERRARMDWYRRELERVDSGGDSSMLDEIDSDAKAEEIMALLKATVNKYGPDGDEFVGEGEEASSELTPEELSMIKMAFNMVATRFNIVIMTLPTWFVLPFEFGATFGMSTWGVDRFVPDHKDEERFIREASGWSELNHPHVAKFLGACHVGDEKFVAHEKVRSMTEYASVEREDRKKVWERMYEVGLALQYMFERGFVCPLVKWDHLYCARYEDRAVMLGVHLRDYGVVTGSSCNSSDENKRHTLIGEPLVESLVIAIVKLFEALAESANKGVPSRDMIEARDDPHTVTSILNTNPACLSDHEWSLVKKLCSKTDGELLQVIDTLGDLAGIHERSDWLEYATILEHQFQSTTHLKEFVIMGETIGQTLIRCRNATPVSEKLLTRLLRRFDDICNQLQDRYSKLSDWSALQESLAHLCSLLHQFSSFAAQKASTSIASKGFCSTSASVAYSRDVMHQLDPGRVHSMHSKMDQFLVLHQLSSSDEVHSGWLADWRTEYGSPAPTRVNDSEPPDSPTLSQWYIPREQIDFNEFDAFSNGAFGSVHKGRWFETPVIVKRVKQHTTTETQFRQEADVWFQLNHINVVKMYGACDIGDLFFVCEYASGGDLDKYLDSKGRDPYLMWYCLLNAALGLQYLHNNGIVHADLKANNILVGGDGVAKLTDFGLSVRAKDPSGASAGALGAYQWKAPECLSGSVATFASDVYSFAMVMIEVMSGSCPWGEDTDNDTLKNLVVTRGRLPPRPSSIGDSEWGLIERMCARDPIERVPMNTVVTHLSSLLQKLDQEQLWLGGIAQPKTFKNRVVSRDGILLNLIDLAKSKNGTISSFAANQIVSVAQSREGPSSEHEIDKVLDMFFHGSDQEKSRGAIAIGALAERNISVIQSSKVISELIMMIASGTGDQKRKAGNTLANLSADADISESVLSLNGVAALLNLVRDGNDDHKTFAARTLANMSVKADISESVLSLNGMEALLDLLRDGNDDHKKFAAMTLAGLSARTDISGSVLLSLNGIKALLDLLRYGNNDQKHAAAMTLANLSSWTEISETVLSLNGIEALLDLVRDGNDDHKNQATITLANLSARADISGSVLSLNGIEALLDLVRDGNDDQKHVAATMLANLSCHADISGSVLSLNGMEALLDLLRDGNNDQKHAAAMTLAGLAGRADISECVLSLNGMEALLNLVRYGNDDHKKFASRTLVNLSARADISESVLSLNGMEALLDLVRDGNDDQKRAAAMTLANLSADADISESVLSLNGVAALLNLVRDGNDDHKTFAARTLANMSVKADISESVLSLNGIEALLDLLRDGNDDQKEEAAMTLANMSRQPDSSASTSSWLPRRMCTIM